MSFSKYTLDNRYAAQPWLIRRWRDRYLVLVPFWFLRNLLPGPVRLQDIQLAWDLTMGKLDILRQNWYTMEEAEAHQYTRRLSLYERVCKKLLGY